MSRTFIRVRGNRRSGRYAMKLGLAVCAESFTASQRDCNFDNVTATAPDGHDAMNDPALDTL
jgi:hypothetical protein